MEEEMRCPEPSDEQVDRIAVTFPQCPSMFSKHRRTNIVKRSRPHCFTSDYGCSSNIKIESHNEKTDFNTSNGNIKNIIKYNTPFKSQKLLAFGNAEKQLPCQEEGEEEEEHEHRIQTGDANEKMNKDILHSHLNKTPLIKRLSKENVCTPYVGNCHENLFLGTKSIKSSRINRISENIHPSAGQVLQNIVNQPREPKRLDVNEKYKPNSVTYSEDNKKGPDVRQGTPMCPVPTKAVQVSNLCQEEPRAHKKNNVQSTCERSAVILNGNKVINCPKELFKTPSAVRNISVLTTNLEKIEIDESKKNNTTTTPHRSKTSKKHVLIVKHKHYTILSKIGQGGSSKVYQVLDEATSHIYAMKCVYLADAELTVSDGYLREIELLSKLQNSNRIIKLIDYEHVISEQTLYVVMEKGDIDLSLLLKHIVKTKDISMPMIIYYWTEMLLAVKEIHDSGIVHADLKPANFLLVNGRLKLIDFGIASSLQNDATSVIKSSMHGTCNYMSPEAIQDPGDASRTKVGYKSDVWSLGCILYNLLYGKTPFQHINNNYAKLQTITNPRYQIDFPQQESCPPALLEAVKLCLKYDSKQRPTVAELLSLPYICTVKH